MFHSHSRAPISATRSDSIRLPHFLLVPRLIGRGVTVPGEPSSSCPDGVARPVILGVRLAHALNLEVHRQPGHLAQQLRDAPAEQTPLALLGEAGVELVVGQDAANVHVSPAGLVVHRPDEVGVAPQRLSHDHAGVVEPGEVGGREKRQSALSVHWLGLVSHGWAPSDHAASTWR